MKKIFVLGATIMMMSACNCNPFMKEWTLEGGYPPFDKIRVSDYVPAVKEGIKQQAAEVDAIVANAEAPTFENTVAAYELSGKLLAKTLGVLYNVSESDATPQMQEVMDEVTPLVTAASDNIFMNPGFFARVKAVLDNAEALDREQYVVTKKLYDSFIDNGVALGEAEQARFKEISSELAVLQQTFGNNLLAESNAFKSEIGIPVSSYPVFMTTCEDRAKREAAFKAYSSRGNHDNANDNKQVILDIMRLRTEKAQLLGYDCSADQILSDKMAHDHQTVDAFLSKIMVKAVAKAKEEVIEMQKFMDKDIEAGILPAGTKIQPWDWWYYAEKVRKAKYAIDENEVKQYFKAENVVNGIFTAAKMLYGVNAEKLEGVPSYNPDCVTTYKLTYDDGSLIGIFTTDYFPRSSKRGGAWMNNIREQYFDADGNDVRPIIVNVGNLSEYMSIDDVQTTFHEFGHALHGLLTKCHYRSVSGTSVTRDFVEMFSQFNENWAFQPELLALYAKNDKGEVIPDALVKKINNSLKFNQGFMTAELCAASILDMKWHELSNVEGIDIDKFETQVAKEIGLIPEITFRYRSTYFNHIFGGSGYNAGYYGYLWSEVLDKDAFSIFEASANGVWDHALATQFKETFLEKGGSEEPMVLYKSFAGREPDSRAMLRGRGLID